MKGIGFPNRLLKESDGLRDGWMAGGEMGHGVGKEWEGADVSISTSTWSFSDRGVRMLRIHALMNAHTRTQMLLLLLINLSARHKSRSFGANKQRDGLWEMSPPWPSAVINAWGCVCMHSNVLHQSGAVGLCRLVQNYCSKCILYCWGDFIMWYSSGCLLWGDIAAYKTVKYGN